MRIARGLAVPAAFLAVLAVLAGCDGGPSSAPEPSTGVSAGSGRVTLPSNMYAEHPPAPGQCLDTAHATVIPCEQPHDAEVISVGKLTATAMPDEATAGTMTMPVC